MKLSLREITIIGLGLLAVTGASVAFWKMKNPSLADIAGAAEPTSSNKPTGPKKPQPPKQEAPQVAKPKSIMEGVDGPLIKTAEEVLLIADEAQRSTQWQALLDRAALYELVRMTEIPAVPKLDEGRKALRFAAVKQIAKTGSLKELIKLRRGFDGQNFSGVLMMAYQEWAKIQPVEALANWHQEGAPPKNASWSDSLARGLALAKPVDAAQAVATLPSEEQIRLSKTLVKETKASGGIAALRDFYAAFVPQQRQDTISAQETYLKLIADITCNEAPAAGAEWAWNLATQSPNAMHQATLKQAIQAWHKVNGPALNQWAESKTPTPSQEDIFIYLVEISAPADPAKANAWAAKMTRPELREKAGKILEGKP